MKFTKQQRDTVDRIINGEGWVQQYTITRVPLELRVLLNFPKHFLLLPAHAEKPPVRPPVYSCKKSAESQYFRGDLQAYKKAHRNRRAYLHQLMSVLMVGLNGLEPSTSTMST